MKHTTYCNPLDLGYRYQHTKEGHAAGFREGADPTLVYFKGKYYLFVSMSAGFWYSEDLLNWEFHADPELLIYDYAPDVRQVGEYLYFCASRREVNCPILRTKDPLTEKFSEVSAPFDFWDPDLFCDEDGRVYFYWGCSNVTPIYGVEMNPETMEPIGEKKALIFNNEDKYGYERPGDNGHNDPTQSVVYQKLAPFFNPDTQRIELPEEMKKDGKTSEDMLTQLYLKANAPYIEGAFMTKHEGVYYLQYACPGTEYNTYADGVYTAESPLGPFTLQKANPFSSKPGGFITGAGHGSTISDSYGNYWHASTMRISINHPFERRVGLFPAGFDKDGVLYCNQNFADYPHRVPGEHFDVAEEEPVWMLLSYKKPVSVSSTEEGSDPALAVNEDIRSWWSAKTAEPGQWLAVDLEEEKEVHAIQVNLADEALVVDFPEESYGDARHTRHIDTRSQISHYVVEGSTDGEHWEILEKIDRECSNAYLESEEGWKIRYVRVMGGELPYGQRLRISGLRIFGKGKGEAPAQVKEACGKRTNPLEAQLTWKQSENAIGYNVRYGTAPDKLYASWLVYETDELLLTTLIAGEHYYACVDSFNENGVTKGEIFEIV